MKNITIKSRNWRSLTDTGMLNIACVTFRRILQSFKKPFLSSLFVFRITVKKLTNFNNFGILLETWCLKNVNVPTSPAKCCCTTLGSAKWWFFSYIQFWLNSYFSIISIVFIIKTLIRWLLWHFLTFLVLALALGVVALLTSLDYVIETELTLKWCEKNFNRNWNYNDYQNGSTRKVHHIVFLYSMFTTYESLLAVISTNSNPNPICIVMAPWKSRTSWYISFFPPITQWCSISDVLFAGGREVSDVIRR